MLSATNPGVGSDSSVSFKIVLVGDIGVGKTSLFLRVRDGKFYDSTFSIIGIDYCKKFLKLDDKEIELKIFDTAGKEKYRTLTHAYYRKSNAVFCLYSVDDPKTLSTLLAWHQDVRKSAPEGQGVYGLLEIVCKRLISEHQKKQEEKHNSSPEKIIQLNDGSANVKNSSCCF